MLQGSAQNNNLSGSISSSKTELLLHQCSFDEEFPIFYSIVSGGQNSLSGGKRRLSGCKGRPPPTSVGRTMILHKYYTNKELKRKSCSEHH